MARFVCLLAAALSLAPLSALAGERVVRTEIEALAGPGVEVTSINNRGAIVGSFPHEAGGQSVPFRWTKTGGVDLFLGNSPGQASDINDGGAIVGFVDHADGTFSGFLWSRRDGLVDLGTFFPSAINNRGQIAGACLENPGAGRPCLWENGVVTELGDGVSFGGAFDINERGQVAGQLLLSPFVWSRSTGLVLLPTSSVGPNVVAAAMAINNSGEVVGFESTDGVISIPVRWTRTGAITTFPQFVRGTFVAVNASGLAIGRYPLEIPGGESGWFTFAVTRRGEVIDLGFGIPVGVNNRGAVPAMTAIDGEPAVVVWVVTP